MDQAGLLEFTKQFQTYAGLILVANLGTICSLIFVGFKATWYLSKLDSRVEHAQDTSNRAHQRIDKIEDKI